MVDLTAQLDLGDLRLRTLLQDDAELLVEATRNEQAPALWAPRPAGPYSLDDAKRALQQWDPAQGLRASYGVVQAERLAAAIIDYTLDRLFQLLRPGMAATFPRQVPADADGGQTGNGEPAHWREGSLHK